MAKSQRPVAMDKLSSSVMMLLLLPIYFTHFMDTCSFKKFSQ